MGSVGGDKVYQRCRVLHVQREVRPACVGRELRITISQRLKLRPRLVQGGHTRITPPRDVDRGQIKRDTDELVAQNVGDEFVNLVANLRGHPPQDSPCGLLCR